MTSDYKLAKHVLHVSMAVCPDVTHAFLLIDIVANKLEIYPFSVPLVNGDFVLLADFVNRLNGGSVTDCGIDMVESGVQLFHKYQVSDSIYI